MSDWLLSEWLLGAALGAAGFCLAMAGLALVSPRFRGVLSAHAEITRITPVFSSVTRLRTDWVELEYAFVARSRGVVSGKTVAPLEFFLGADPVPMAALWRDPRISLPVLAHGDERRVGEEAIEDYLLQHRNRLEVRYAYRSPERNAPAGLDPLVKKIVENRP